MPLGMEVVLSPGHIVLDGTQLPIPQKAGTAPQFLAHVYCYQTFAHLSYCGSLVSFQLALLCNMYFKF